ncbi:hypothetical protein AURDEDRAFT_131825 [Auricularia subglabra TFB-10046 SS5]|uniref:Uncharacterized protein n=1 Tax=Auricularia subglabra (strain TFB-10046 / SS5) TaxID=717982 RepID=J0L9U6_AURST|nr:hypothetical protein AURDEDRAFT_131825 [Auricularia subglabra TFB-10046 SS5]
MPIKRDPDGPAAPIKLEDIDTTAAVAAPESDATRSLHQFASLATNVGWFTWRPRTQHSLSMQAVEDLASQLESQGEEMQRLVAENMMLTETVRKDCLAQTFGAKVFQCPLCATPISVSPRPVARVRDLVIEALKYDGKLPELVPPMDPNLWRAMLPGCFL